MKKKQLPPRGPQLKLAGDISVAFVNTAAARDKNRQLGVGSYAEWLGWAQQAGILQPLDAERLSAAAKARPEAAVAAYARADQLRGVLARLFVAQQLGEELPAGDLHAFNEGLSEALPALRVVPGDPGLRWGWGGTEDALDRMLWPVLHAAARLLISTEGRPEVRQCALSGCRLFFVDRTPSRQRRWCDMKTCGNRAKALRYYRRTGRAAREKSFRGIGLWQQRRPRESKIRL